MGIMLNTLSLKDATEKYVNWLNDSEVNKYLECRMNPNPHTIETVKAYIDNMLNSMKNYLLGIFDIRYKSAMDIENNVINSNFVAYHIGNIKIGPINNDHRFAELGIMIGDKEYWGKGYGTKAIEKACVFALAGMKLHKLTAGMYANNIGSYKAFIKAGFKEVGTLKEHRIFNGEYVDQIIVEKILCN